MHSRVPANSFQLNPIRSDAAAAQITTLHWRRWQCDTVLLVFDERVFVFNTICCNGRTAFRHNKSKLILQSELLPLICIHVWCRQLIAALGVEAWFHSASRCCYYERGMAIIRRRSARKKRDTREDCENKDSKFGPYALNVFFFFFI